jgi:hypothetical protein
MEEIEAKIDNIPGIMDKTSEAECVEEVIDFALTYLDPFKDFDRLDTEIVEYYVKQNFDEYWSLS